MARTALRAAAVLVVAALSTTAFAQWSFEWYVDPDVGGPGLIVDNLAVPVAADSGNYVYLIHDVDSDGLDFGSPAVWDGVLTDDDVIVQVWSGAWAGGEIGTDDLFLNPQDAGEVHKTSILDETVYTGDLYAVAFDGPVNVLGQQTFSGFGWYGVSAGSTTLDNPIDSWNIGGFNTPNQLIPEPTTVALMVLGLGGVIAYRRKRSA